jgi:RimJ/RimL family protein N-acetyltransferase
MQLLPIDTPDRLQLVARWLAEKENYQWLELGDGRQPMSVEWLTIALQRKSYALRLFTSDVDDRPIGVVALSNINEHFKTANIWVVVGDKAFASRGYASVAASKMLTIAFKELGLEAIHTWIVEHNQSVRMAKRLKFRLIGRQRQSHSINGCVYDRLWFDLLASEHEEIHDVKRRQTA